MTPGSTGRSLSSSDCDRRTTWAPSRGASTPMRWVVSCDGHRSGSLVAVPHTATRCCGDVELRRTDRSREDGQCAAPHSGSPGGHEWGIRHAVTSRVVALLSSAERRDVERLGDSAEASRTAGSARAMDAHRPAVQHSRAGTPKRERTVSSGSSTIDRWSMRLKSVGQRAPRSKACATVRTAPGRPSAGSDTPAPR